MSPQPPPSAIKPHLLRLSGDDGRLEGMLVERVVEDAFADDRHDPSGPSSHVIVIPTRPAELSWKDDGRNRNSRFAPGEIILNPKGNFVRPRWSDPTEFLLLGLDSRLLSTRLAEMEMPELLLSPKFRFKDELLYQLARALVENYEGENSPPDPLYADAIACALVAHLARCSGRPPLPLGRKPALPAAKLRLVDDYIHPRRFHESLRHQRSLRHRKGNLRRHRHRHQHRRPGAEETVP